MSKYNSSFSDPLEFIHTDEPFAISDKNEIKFDIYVKIRELKQISEGLHRIHSLPKKEKETWLSDNESFMSEMMESVLQETMGTIDGIQLDSEALELSVELVSTMRDT